MYVTDAEGKIVQFQYANDDSDEELLYQSKTKLQGQQEQGIMSAKKTHQQLLKAPPGKQMTIDDVEEEDETADLENDKELKQLSLY